MKNKLEQIDEILASYEDWMHGVDGERCTEARKLLREIQQELQNNEEYLVNSVYFKSEK